MNWYGELTTDNIEYVANLFKQLLTDRKYTFVVVNGSYGYKPEVRTNQEICADKAKDKQAISTYKTIIDGYMHAGMIVVDTYGVWSISTGITDKTFISFDYNKVTIQQKNGYGDKLFWVIALQ